MSQSNYKETFKVHRRFIPYIFILIFFSNILWAKDVQILYPNYDQAKKATPFIKFSSTSTKLGFITTDFDGFAKKFKYSYELDGNILKSIIITIDATSFDTDSDGRNEKMNSEILNSKDFTQILAKLKMPVTLSEGSFTTDGSFTIKNIELIKPIKYEVKKIDNKFIIKGHAKIGLKEAQLPDPSIAIAKVRDDFDLDFEIEL